MPVFQVGITVSRKVYTDVIVRVEAEDMAHANKAAFHEVQRQIGAGELDASHLKVSDYDWDHSELSIEEEGSSEEDYSNQNSFTPDLDLTKKSG